MKNVIIEFESDDESRNDSINPSELKLAMVAFVGKCTLGNRKQSFYDALNNALGHFVRTIGNK